ncbi:di-heme oxidoredictase family protein [Sinisalibacter aestuarii]|uniref:Thiol oxidoreductase n=1 Tax=Sinisalibacter aestuarii TaxID=2949426 RepID=A0ABQ5LP07_9RHOB|nr:di-heme oxidoredictase family protein [Sinisalibacter aestuarii]GKY86729.1 thiol oxidoreductase [Sinisalibacter aestuarii]
MRSSMPRRWTKANNALVLALIVAGRAALATDGPAPADTPRPADEAARVAAVTAPATSFDAAEAYEVNAGGAGTYVAPRPETAFMHPPANITAAGDLDFISGQALFEKIWVAAPTATQASDGLGPHYNARACVLCHVNNGRGHPPAGPDDRSNALVMHIAVPGPAPDEMAAVEGWLANLPDPIYGRQVQTFATIGLDAEARLRVTWEEAAATLGDGSVVSLRRPTYSLDDLAQGPLAAETMRSPRVAPQMIGLGLLEAIPADEILAREDPDDRDGDGISGRANIVWSDEYAQPMLGRFGWKAGHATVRHQSATAFANDIGISTPVHPAGWGDCTGAQAACRAAPHGDGDARVFEADAETLDLTTFYAANLAVPARRDVNDAQVLAGKRLFYDSGCIACHTPKHVTARIADRPESSFQLIWPYTDLLLHDMGPGLADGYSEGLANGREYRTPPLWGIGLTRAVSGETSFLHDGRARTLLEAILWHGGEAQAARDRVAAMAAADRDALIRFLESL